MLASEAVKTAVPTPLENMDVETQTSKYVQINVARVSSSNLFVCRICHVNQISGENLISPCHCKGSLGFVHLSCLERWLNQSGRSNCELCGFKYNSVRTLRYTLCESCRLWLRRPGNKAHIQSDMLVISLLTFVTMGLVSVCFVGMEYFLIEARRMGIGRTWTKGCILIFVIVVVLGYVSTVYLVIRDHFIPWYNWWRRSIDVRLTLTPSVMKSAISEIP